MAQKSFRSSLRSAILGSLAPGEERQLTRPVSVKNNSMVGLGEIVGIYRRGLRGAAMCIDRFDQCYSLSELSEAVCAEILDAL